MSADKHATAARVPLPRDEDLTPEIAQTLATLPPLNVFRMMANVPASFQPLIDLAMSILLGSELDARTREIAVLRVARATGATYVWTQHVALGRQVGLDEATIAAIDVDGAVGGLDEEGNLLCRVADEISRDVGLSDEALAAILARYGTRRASELILCCSYFNMLARFLASVRIELEPAPVL